MVTTPEDGVVATDETVEKAKEEAEKARKEEIAKKLEAYGKPEPDVFDAFKYVVFLRARDTTAYMKERF